MGTSLKVDSRIINWNVSSRIACIPVERIVDTVIGEPISKLSDTQVAKVGTMVSDCFQSINGSHSNDTDVVSEPRILGPPVCFKLEDALP